MTRDLRLAALVAWLLATAILLAVAAPGILHLWFPDSDDAMRLQEVRDWIGGQGFWDVSQHRLVGPIGTGAFAMHWSRIVDLPLAATMLLGDPLFGSAASTRIAMTIVPLALLLATIVIMARLVSRLGGKEHAKLGVLLVPLAPPITYQLQPLRIDHHGWQLMLAVAAVAALMAIPSRRSGALAGAALATLVSVSLEGLPITAAIFGVALLAWAHDPARRPQAAAMTAMLLGGTVLIHIIQRGPAMLTPACDAIAPAWIAALAVACGGVALTLWQAVRPVTRLAGIAVAGLAGAVTLRIAAPVCTLGPFATLDPLVYHVWYRHIAEGLPGWEQKPAAAFMIYALPPVGLAGAFLAFRATASEARVRWIMMLAIAAAAFAFSLLVARGAATANALAIPGAAWLLDGWLRRARAVQSVLPRVAATATALLAAAPGLTATVLVTRASSQGRTEALAEATASGVMPCREGREVIDLDQLRPGLVFAPLDISPSLIAWTRHKAIGSGYHRNAPAIHAVLATFLGSPDHARASVFASGADYVAGCPGENETRLYKQLAPNGFWAQLERGQRFPWLRRIPIAGSPVLAWRVVRGGTPALAGE